MKEICAIDLQDEITFQIKQISHIIDEMEYPGIRITMNAYLGKMPVPMKIDVSTGDVITPGEVQYQYNWEEGSIKEFEELGSSLLLYMEFTSTASRCPYCHHKIRHIKDYRDQKVLLGHWNARPVSALARKLVISLVDSIWEWKL